MCLKTFISYFKTKITDCGMNNALNVYVADIFNFSKLLHFLISFS